MATIELVSASAISSPPPAIVQSTQAQPPRIQKFFVTSARSGESDAAAASLETQMQRAWLNLLDAIRDAGFDKSQLRYTIMYVTVGGQCRLFRRVRDQMLQRLPVPSSCIQVEDLEIGVGNVAIEGEAAAS